MSVFLHFILLPAACLPVPHTAILKRTDARRYDSELCCTYVLQAATAHVVWRGRLFGLFQC